MSQFPAVHPLGCLRRARCALVRHMCEAYWNSDHVAASVGSFGDAEVRIASRHGAMSWRVQFTGTGEEALLRTASEDASFHESATVRLLDVVCERQSIEDGSSSARS